MKSPSIPLAASWCAAIGLFAALASATTGTAQQAAPAAPAAPPGAGRGRGPAPTDTLGAGPWDLGTGRGRTHVKVVTKGLDHPWGIAFLPDGGMLVTERPGRLRVVRNGVLDPTPIGPMPQMLATGLGGLLDVALHPRFAENRLIYLAYSKPGEGQGNATTAVLRARWDGGSTLDRREGHPGGRRVSRRSGDRPGSGDGSLGPASGSYGSRLAFDTNGLLYVTLGDRNIPPKAQDPASHIGKILRLRDDGTVPPDNPFVGKAGYKPEIYTLGHRNPLGLAFNPLTNELWSTEQGPQGGDELNLIQAGKNYGWPRVSLGTQLRRHPRRRRLHRAGLRGAGGLLGAGDRRSRASRSTTGTSSPPGRATRSSAACAPTPGSTCSACSSTRRGCRPTGSCCSAS